jgi:hypothetical protein
MRRPPQYWVREIVRAELQSVDGLRIDGRPFRRIKQRVFKASNGSV